MKASDDGVRFVAGEEGFVDHVYFDQVGRKTIGYGHLLTPGESYPNGITRNEALVLLRSDIGTAERAVSVCVQAPLAQAQFDALVSLAFNIGGPRLARSRLVGRLNAGDVGELRGDPKKLESYSGALREWAEFRMGKLPSGQVVVLPVLVARRAREIAMFLAPEQDAA